MATRRRVFLLLRLSMWPTGSVGGRGAEPSPELMIGVRLTAYGGHETQGDTPHERGRFFTSRTPLKSRLKKKEGRNGVSVRLALTTFPQS